MTYRLLLVFKTQFLSAGIAEHLQQPGTTALPREPPKLNYRRAIVENNKVLEFHMVTIQNFQSKEQAPIGKSSTCIRG